MLQGIKEKHQLTSRSSDLLYIHSKEYALCDTIPLNKQEDIREESEGTEDEEISRPAEGTKKTLKVWWQYVILFGFIFVCSSTVQRLVSQWDACRQLLTISLMVR
jgi:hypothetical protein